ncbi:MAG TPA: hypothetical protein VIX37_11815 [Candidatus Sulfotelmatobacter sp.]
MITTELHPTTKRIEEIVLKDGKVTFPSWYDPKKGLRAGRVFELHCFFDVKPGHAEQLKQACRDHPTNTRKATDKVKDIGEGIDQIGIHDNSATLFDNDTRFLFTTTFDTEWDPYIEDVAKLLGGFSYYNMFQHCVGVPEGLDGHNLSVDYVKALFNAARETAVMYTRSYPNTVAEIRRALKLQEVFQQVLDHPDAAKALEHPALAPLLEMAAD